MALNPKAKAETIWIFRTEREQYFKMIAALSFVMCIESRGNVRGDKCAVAFMAAGVELCDKAALLPAVDSIAICGRRVELTYKIERRAECCI